MRGLIGFSGLVMQYKVIMQCNARMNGKHHYLEVIAEPPLETLLSSYIPIKTNEFLV